MSKPIDYSLFFFEHEGMEIRRADLEVGMRFKVDPTIEYGFELKQMLPDLPHHRIFYAERQLPEGEGSLLLTNLDLVRNATGGDHTHNVQVNRHSLIVRRNAQGSPVGSCRIKDIPLDPEDARPQNNQISCLEAELLIGFRWGGHRGAHNTPAGREAVSRFLRDDLIVPSNEACFDYQLTEKGEKAVFAMLKAGSEVVRG